MGLKNSFVILLAVLLSGVLGAQAQEVVVRQDARVDSLMALKTIMQTNLKLTDTYTIQLHYGTLEQAQTHLQTYNAKYDQWPAVIEYETPNYKVWVGNFYSRLEAD
ncbi:MAG: SPOR domain-containing protein, partial [Bacteroidetes bacterium]|nr:SPOR domain-containing protein [Bacteroidota bacterium]